MEPTISVITLTYGQQDYILETIKSVVNQEYNGFVEYIIANDNSPDNTDEIIKDYLANTSLPTNMVIRYTNHTENKGMTSNFIWALKQANGEYIAICEGDDYWIDNNKLQNQMNILRLDPEITICCSNYYELKNRTLNSNFNNNLKQDKYFGFENLLRNNMIATLTAVFKNLGISFWNELEQILLTNNFLIADYVLWLLLMEKGGKIAKYTDKTSVYRLLEESASHSKNELKLINIELNVLEIREIFFKRNYNIKEKREIFSDILNDSYYVLQNYNHKLSIDVRNKIYNTLIEHSMRLDLKNKLKKAYKWITKN